jgi:hypothetical protein
LAFEANGKQMANDLQAVRAELKVKAEVLEEAERALTATQIELAQVTGNRQESSVATEAVGRSGFLKMGKFR